MTDQVVDDSSAVTDSNQSGLMVTATDEHAPRVSAPLWTQGREVGVWLLAAFALAVGLYVVLRPENYGLTPNSLDPLFYTGYAINFDDILNAVTDRHYFVSRWSAYFPAYIAERVAGPIWGRLILRLILAATILCAVWWLGLRQKWSWGQRVLIGSLVITMPMFVRAFFTDYVEYAVVALGLILVAVCVRGGRSVVSGLAAGTLAAAIVVANPIAITAVALPLAVLLLFGDARGAQRVKVAAAVLLAGMSVVVGGMLMFRWRYDIDNVYQPSIDFVRSYEGRDPWKSSRIDWLWYYAWLWVTPVMLVVAASLSFRRHVRFERFEKASLGLCGAQYAYQWVDQFARDGNGLEISYYWSFAYPSFAIAFALVVGRLTAGTRIRNLVLVLGVWITLLVVGVPDLLRLPNGLALGALLLIATVCVSFAADRSLWLAATGLIVLTGWMQIGAPSNQPRRQDALDSSPRYDELYRQAGDLSETIYEEAVWFEQQMDRVANDASTSFVPVGGWSTSITGLYAPHVVGRVMGIDPDENSLTPVAVSEVLTGKRPIVAVFGPPDKVEEMVDSFPDSLGVGREVLDVSHDSALGYRLVVFTMPDASTPPFTWIAADLPIAGGEILGTTVRLAAPHAPGFVTYGPYQALQPGAYELTVEYSGSSSATTMAGAFEAVSLGNPPAASISLPGTDAEVRQVELQFSNEDAETPWEFRTSWSGSGDIVIHSISISQQLPS